MAGTSTDEAKCFVTKNSRDFANPDVYADLKAYKCKLLTGFGDGLRYMWSQVRAADQESCAKQEEEYSSGS